MSPSQVHSNAEAELAPNAVIERREWFEITLSCIGEGVIAADRKGRVNHLNPVAEKLTGWPLADAAGEEIEKVFRSVHETTGKPLPEPVGKVIERGTTVLLEDNCVTEMMDPACVLFGDGRLLEAICRDRSCSTAEECRRRVGEVQRWRGAASVQDDISIVPVEVSRVVNAERIASVC